MEFLFQMIILALLLLYPAWRIFARTGFSSAIALVVLIPGIGVLIALGVLAFAEWPVHRYGGDSAQEGEFK